MLICQCFLRNISQVPEYCFPLYSQELTFLHCWNWNWNCCPSGGHTSRSRGEGWGCRYYQAILLLHIPVGHSPSPLHHVKAELLPSAMPFCRTIASHFITSQVRRATGTWCFPTTPLCTKGLGMIPSNLATPKRQALLTNPSSIQTFLHTSSPSQSPPSPLRKWNYHPEVPLAPSKLHSAFPPGRAGWELTQKWHVCSVTDPLRCPVCGKASLMLWRGPWEEPVSRGHRSLCWSRAEAPPVLENLLLLQSWGTASRLKNWGAHAKNWSWSLIPFPSPLNTRKTRALPPALPLLGWHTWAPPGYLQVSFLLNPHDESQRMALERNYPSIILVCNLHNINIIWTPISTRSCTRTAS